MGSSVAPSTDALGLRLSEEIWQWVAAIPPGRVATYGQIARLCGSTLPWFRVLRATGELAFALGGSDWKRQKALLEAEGVWVVGGKVSLKLYKWDT
jgi:methylated-DNA-protein-cysteine methyltransferase-like protein